MPEAKQTPWCFVGHGRINREHHHCIKSDESQETFMRDLLEFIIEYGEEANYRKEYDERFAEDQAGAAFVPIG